MANPPKQERNDMLVKLKNEGWSFRQLADFFNIDVRAAWEIYERESGRSVEKSAGDGA
ncbi:hypothetical protein HZA87_01380 [Candidatus Uhrbacteria bacterium]|nr:hypothetical protein [Candidatus Uhrbacteria bacterium]